MRSIKAIFGKHARDLIKNPMSLVMFLTFPGVAFFMTLFVAGNNEDMPANMFVTMMAAIFAGMGLINAVSDAIAEDIERKSLRFMVLAGVKPHQYLLGTGGFYIFAGALTSVVFALIGDFTAQEKIAFLVIMVAGVTASVLLGATIGMCAKNRQASTALAMPVAVVVGFVPMIAGFNETVERFAGVLYTQQINVIVEDFSAGLLGPLLVIAGNVAVLFVLFVVAYARKGAKG